MSYMNLGVKVPSKRVERLSRSEKQRQTAAAIVSAAAEVFAERGFHGSSVEEIVGRAGLSRGAFYSNYSDKEDLFLAVLDARFAAARAAIGQIVGSAGSMDELLGALRSREATEADGHLWVLLRTEFRLHALRNPQIRARLAERERDVRAGMAEAIAASFAAVGVHAPAPTALLAVIVQVLDEGIPLMEELDPTAVPPGTFQDALGLLFEASTALASARAAKS